MCVCVCVFINLNTHYLIIRGSSFGISLLCVILKKKNCPRMRGFFFLWLEGSFYFFLLREKNRYKVSLIDR